MILDLLQSVDEVIYFVDFKEHTVYFIGIFSNSCLFLKLQGAAVIQHEQISVLLVSISVDRYTRGGHTNKHLYSVSQFSYITILNLVFSFS